MLLKGTIWFLVFLCLFNIVLAQQSSEDFKLTGTIVQGGGYHSSADFKLYDVIGQLVIGETDSESFKLSHGLIGGAGFLSSPDLPGGGSVTGGGVGCAEGFINKGGVCVPIVSLDIKINESNTTDNISFPFINHWVSPAHPMIGLVVIIFVLILVIMAIIRVGDNVEEYIDKRRKKWKEKEKYS